MSRVWIKILIIFVGVNISLKAFAVKDNNSSPCIRADEEKDLYILCTKNTKTTKFKNYCEDKNYQPVIDIRKTKNGYYLFGIAMNLPEKY